MPRRVPTILAALTLSVGANVFLAWRVHSVVQGLERPEPIMCRDAELKAYSPGAIVFVDGELKRCRVVGMWVSRDEWGNPLVEEAVPAPAALPEG